MLSASERKQKSILLSKEIERRASLANRLLLENVWNTEASKKLNDLMNLEENLLAESLEVMIGSLCGESELDLDKFGDFVTERLTDNGYEATYNKGSQILRVSWYKSEPASYSSYEDMFDEVLKNDLRRKEFTFRLNNIMELNPGGVGDSTIFSKRLVQYLTERGFKVTVDRDGFFECINELGGDL